MAKLLLYIAKFWRFWSKNVTFLLFNQPKTEFFFETMPPPPRVSTSRLYQRCIYI